MDTKAQQKVIGYLNEAHATESALVRTLEAHVAVTPTSAYRTALDRHLRETRQHAQRVRRRLSELGATRSLVDVGVGIVESLVGQALALGKGPVDLVRGDGPEEKLLKNAKDEAATEALEIATYDALEAFARAVGDERTAELAADVRAEEERMLAVLREQIPRLTGAVVSAELHGGSPYDLSTVGAADAARSVGAEARAATNRAAQGGRHAVADVAAQSRRVPGVAQAEGELRGAASSEKDLPISGYDELTVEQVTAKLGGLSQVELSQTEAYERKRAGRSTVLDAVHRLQGSEPWAGYDEMTVPDVRRRIDGATGDTLGRVVAYEQAHKGRAGVLKAVEHERDATGA